jgi:hypothetical protein
MIIKLFLSDSKFMVQESSESHGKTLVETKAEEV